MNKELIGKAKEYLEDFRAEYKIEDVAKEKELNKIRKKFVNDFSIDYIRDEMKKDNYCLGHDGDKTTFCYIIERTLRGLGSILGAQASKFLLYWSKEGNRYLPTKRIGTDEDAVFEIIKAELIKIITAAKNNNMSAISGNNTAFSYMIRHKVFYLYNPENDLPIFSEDHLDKILSLYEIDYIKDANEETNKRLALLNFKRNDPDFSKMSNREFMSFLYNEKSGLDIKAKKIIAKNIKDETIDFEQINNLEDLSSKTHNNNSGSGQTDINDVANKKSYIGEAGEDLVLRYEKSKHPAFKRKIKKVSSDHTLGYDIKSFNDNGEEVHIEVKTKVNGGPNNIDFYITQNEYGKLLSDKHYIIYYVCGIKRKNKMIYAINKETISSVKPVPILYKIKARKI